jgi:pilus assembly protein CpaE
MSKLTAVVITGNSSVRLELERALSQIETVRQIQHAIEPDQRNELGLLLESHRPFVCFLDMSSVEEGLEMAEFVSRHSPDSRLIAVREHLDSQALLPAMRAGVVEFLVRPLQVVEVREALARIEALRLQTADESNPIVTFLPAKPGVGASTLCVNTAAALGNVPQRQVGLLDLDLNCGNVDFLLNLDAGHSVRDLAPHLGPEMDADLWSRMVTRYGKIDVLRAGKPDPQQPVSSHKAESLLRFAAKRYSAVCVDVGGMADPAAFAALRMSRRIVLVTTSELASLHMSGRILRGLAECGLEDRVRVVLNRNEPSSGRMRSRVEQVLGQPLLATVPNHYGVMQQALQAGQGVIQNGPLGRCFAHLASELWGAPQQTGPTGVLGYLNRFFSSRPETVRA